MGGGGERRQNIRKLPCEEINANQCNPNLLLQANPQSDVDNSGICISIPQFPILFFSKGSGQAQGLLVRM